MARETKEGGERTAKREVGERCCSAGREEKRLVGGQKQVKFMLTVLDLYSLISGEAES